MNEEKRETEVDLRDLAVEIWRAKAIVILVTAVCIIAAGMYAFIVEKPVYESSVTLKVPVIWGSPAYVIPTGVEIANHIRLNADAPTGVSAGAVAGKNANIIVVTFRGANPADVKKYGDLYQEAAIEKLSKLVQEDPALRQINTNISLLHSDMTVVNTQLSSLKANSNDAIISNADLLKDKLEETLMEYRKQIDGIKVEALNEIVMPIEPIKSKRSMLLGMGTVIGFMLGCSFVLLRYFWRVDRG